MDWLNPPPTSPHFEILLDLSQPFFLKMEVDFYLATISSDVRPKMSLILKQLGWAKSWISGIPTWHFLGCPGLIQALLRANLSWSPRGTFGTWCTWCASAMKWDTSKFRTPKKRTAAIRHGSPGSRGWKAQRTCQDMPSMDWPTADAKKKHQTSKYRWFDWNKMKQG